jgi:hypothetical protein
MSKLMLQASTEDVSELPSKTEIRCLLWTDISALIGVVIVASIGLICASI